MPLKAWSAFLPDARTSLPECPDPLIEHYLREAAIEFCSRSKRLKSDGIVFETESGKATYELDAGETLNVIDIVSASINGKPIGAMLGTDLTDQDKTETGEPFCALLEETNVVRFVKVPDNIYSVEMTLSVAPSDEAEGVETWIADQYRRVIVSGALAQLMILPERRWTNAALSVFHSDKFEEGVRSAVADCIKSGTSAPLRTKKVSRY